MRRKRERAAADEVERAYCAWKTHRGPEHAFMLIEALRSWVVVMLTFRQDDRGRP